MSIDNILVQIDAEIARLTQARSLLANIGTSTVKVAEAKVKQAPTTATATAKAKTRKKKRVLSAEARKRIADAQRKRWAAQKAKTPAKSK
jgi:hypothetical protein